MIVDTFLFGWELDLLEMRLIEMGSFVDFFVVAESDQTFQGEKKPYVFLENQDRFDRWLHKIVYVQADLSQCGNPWGREFASREAIKPILKKFPDDAIILHGDVDELMSCRLGKNVRYIVDCDDVFVLEQDLYSMAVDWLYPLTWQGTTVAYNRVVKNMSMVDFRNARISGRKIRDGWHFTWLGGVDMIRKKAASFSHTEDEIQNYIKNMGERLYFEGFHVRGEKLVPVDVDDSFPKYIYSRMCPVEWFRPK